MHCQEFTHRGMEGTKLACIKPKGHVGPHRDAGFGEWEDDPTILDLATPGVVPTPDRSVQAPQIRDIHGIKSTKLPQLDLLPKAALVALANRMELGIARKGVDGVWNHRKETSSEFVIERLSHVIHHAYDAIDKLKRGVPLIGEDDAGAILFGGAVLAVYKDNIAYGEPELLQDRENAKKVFEK